MSNQNKTAALSALVSANQDFNDIIPASTFKGLSQHNPVNVLKYSADPGVMVYDDTVYVYGTNDGIIEKMDDNPSNNEYS